MAFSEAPYFGGRHVEEHREDARIRAQLHQYLGLGIYWGIRDFEYRIWPKVVWVWVPGFRPEFVSRRELGI